MTEEEDGPKRALAQALADHGYVDGDRDEQYRLIDTHPIIAALASRGYAIVSLGLEGIPAENKRLRHDLGALYSRMRHTHPDAVPCVDAGLKGHPPSFADADEVLAWREWADKVAVLHGLVSEGLSPLYDRIKDTLSEEERNVLAAAIVWAHPPTPDEMPAAAARVRALIAEGKMPVMGATGVAPRFKPAVAGSEDAASKYLNAFHRLLDITQGEATDEEIEHYRLNADDPTNRLLNWGEWREHLLDQLVTDMRETLMTGMHQPSGV